MTSISLLRTFTTSEWIRQWRMETTWFSVSKSVVAPLNMPDLLVKNVLRDTRDKRMVRVKNASVPGKVAAVTQKQAVAIIAPETQWV